MIEILGMSLYLVIMLICGIMLIVIAFLGADFGIDHDVDAGGGFGADGASGVEHFEGGHGDFSGAHLNPLSLPLILAFGTAFGGFGAVFENMGTNPFLTPLWAALISLAISGVLYLLMDRLFVQTQASSEVRYATLIGKEATVTIPIKAGMQGQILVITEERGRTLLSASSSDDLPTETAVIIEGFSGGTVKVKRKTN